MPRWLMRSFRRRPFQVGAVGRTRCGSPALDRDSHRSRLAGVRVLRRVLGVAHAAFSRHRNATLEIALMMKSVRSPIPPITSSPANDHEAF